MSPDSVRVSGPSREEYVGDSTGQIVKRLFNATRPKFFPASIMPVLAGSAWGFMIAGSFDWPVFLLALFATMCVHAGANVLNDVGDESGGTDRRNEDRIYPYTGGSRFIQLEIMSASAMARLGISLLAAAAIAGLVLLLGKGIMILWFGLAGVTLAVLYSLGPVRLSSLGLGEIGVGIGLGMLPVVGAAWLQSGVIDASVIAFAIPVSAWVTAILLINEVPDIEADSATGKRTLPVRLGLNGTAVVYFALQTTPAVAIAWLVYTGRLSWIALIVPVGLILLGARAAQAIRTGISDRDGMTRAIEMTLGIHTIGCLWLVAYTVYNGAMSM